MTRLMTHLVANYPNPIGFKQALEAMLDSQVEYLEIQLPFSNPLADGETIYQANRVALAYDQSFEETMNTIKSIYIPRAHKTKLILMSYITPITKIGILHVLAICKASGFKGFIIPDLIFGNKEQLELSSLCQGCGMYLIPVISDVTNLDRIKQIKTSLTPQQPIYAMARKGKTGDSTDLTEINDYLVFLKNELSDYDIAVGFGIRDKEQVDYLNDKNIIAVIGSKIVEIINSSSPKNIKNSIKHFINQLN